jgi:hypothetical protein
MVLARGEVVAVIAVGSCPVAESRVWGVAVWGVAGREIGLSTAKLVRPLAGDRSGLWDGLDVTGLCSGLEGAVCVKVLWEACGRCTVSVRPSLSNRSRRPPGAGRLEMSRRATFSTLDLVAAVTRSTGTPLLMTVLLSPLMTLLITVVRL